MAKYETMLITSAALDERPTAALVGKFQDPDREQRYDRFHRRVGQAPSQLPHQRRGGRRLHCQSTSPAVASPLKLDRVYKITEGVMRSLIVAHEVIFS